MAAHDVTVIIGEATIEGEDGERNILISCNGETITAAKILLSTGSETIIPPIKGLSESGYWTSKEALDNKDVPESLAVIGGGVIGVEFASFFNSLGVKVTVIEMLPEIDVYKRQLLYQVKERSTDVRYSTNTGIQVPCKIN